ncbi:GNAT family N-acetyltransferase [Paenibacillus koleovorans]|uniref:GNAT family N-acetyltransferase n=1 Tax=Paenibacillus koleovorans TaxID=121608 RepID=UPI000FDB1E0B|nr:GNAT family N-acetyltransferase [Paenibacillus koleovorans]
MIRSAIGHAEIIKSTQAVAWTTVLSWMPEKDIYYTCEYNRLYEVEGEQQAELFVYREGDRLVVYPYLLRSLKESFIVQALGLPGEWYDIATPYGYGGPITNTPPGPDREKLFAAFSDMFAAVCKERQVLTEFVRFHPLLGNAADYPGVETRLNRHTAAIDLRGQTEADLTEHYCSNHKKNIRKFRSSPLQVGTASPEEGLDAFIELYYGTMNDLQANPFYYFPRSYFESTVRHLQGKLELFEIRDGEHPIAACLVMHEHPWMHYHLSGWKREYLHWAPTKMLIHAASGWGIERGFEQFHLGGGYTGDDRLFDFKRGFATHLPPLEYWLGQRVLFPDLYERFRTKWGSGVNNDYFPLYRHPALGSLAETRS